MSKQNNLTDFLTDVANAIRTKKGTTGLINPQNFSAEIASISGGGGLEVIEMTETTATIEPNKVYVWGMVESLNITLGASTNESDFFAFRFRCSKPTMTVVTVNGATWADDTELDAQGKPILDLGSYYQCEIKGGTSALYARLAHYIPFEDSNVEAVLMSKGVGDGIGITYKDAAKVTTISTWFKSNADITAFEELKHFKGLTGLESNAFLSCSALRSITLPSSISSISYYAFKSCTALEEVKNFENTSIEILQDEIFRGTSLKSIVLPKTVTFININAFYGCSSLREIAFPESLTKINGGAFYGCSSLREVVLKEGFTTFYRYNIFQNCTSLLYVKLPSTLKSNLTDGIFRGCTSLLKVEGLENSQVPIIQGSAFYGCSALTEIAFPASLTSIGNDAFNGCSALTEIALPAGVTLIEQSAFSGCKLLARVLNLENTKVTKFENGVFNECAALTEVSLPASLTSIGQYAFLGCKSLTRAVNFENTQLTSISSELFRGCSSLTEITLPAGVTSIGSNAFYGCSSLQYIRIEATTPPTLASTNAIPSTIGAIYVPDESVAAYQAATNWSSFASKIKGISEMPAK